MSGSLLRAGEGDGFCAVWTPGGVRGVQYSLSARGRVSRARVSCVPSGIQRSDARIWVALEVLFTFCLLRGNTPLAFQWF